MSAVIHYDNPASDKGVWLNPNVRVAYRTKGIGIGSAGGWVAREVGEGVEWSCWVCDSFVEITPGKWEDSGEGSGVGGNAPGVDCLIDEMQVSVDNGWKHLEWALSSFAFEPSALNFVIWRLVIVEN